MDEAGNFLPKSGQHGIRDIGIGLKMADTGIGADGGPDISGITAEMGGHGLHGPGADGGRGTTPTGMDGTDGAGHRIFQQNGRAIGGGDKQCQPRGVGDHAVAGRTGGLSRDGAPVLHAHRKDDIRMGLAGIDDIRRRDTQNGADAAVISVYNGFYPIP